ncbi:protein FLOURY 1 [Impatiens glandulifera]|uniref:protein FLOURY 1 n=1 Tax=Impatiens glandulifera TaxID=253017 RepID=UPI001FB071E4|nr:protein FLOURY 1 [Impatiens glandulifera]
MGWKALKCGLHFKGISSDCKGKSSVMTNGFPLKRNTNFLLMLEESDDIKLEVEETNVNNGEGGLKKMVSKLNEELEKERLAAATAAEEAMAMIMRLQNEKSTILMESKQYRLMAEKKQVHDREVIQSLRWIVKKHETARKLLENRLMFLSRKLRLCFEGNNNNIQWVEDGDDDEYYLRKYEEDENDISHHPSGNERSGELLLSSLDLGS